MGIDFWKKFVFFLLPKSKAFRAVIERTLTKFFTAVAYVPKWVHDHLSAIFLEVFPSTTTQVLNWSKQFGFAGSQTRSKLAAEWKQEGGQSPNYLQTALQDAGFDVYVHEWWRVDGDEKPIQMGDGTQMGDGAQMGGKLPIPAGYPVARNPIPYINDFPPNNLLVNPVDRAYVDYKHQMGDGTQMGDGAQMGANNGIKYIEKIYPHPDNGDDYPYYMYVGGETWPEVASVEGSRRTELLRIIYKIKSINQRVVLLVNFTATTGNVWENSPNSELIFENSPDGIPVVENSPA